jgi:Amt family ammonium transporter
VLGNLDLTWIIVGTVLVFFMQAGFAFLEIGFSRGKNAGMGIAKILVNFSLATIAWWAVGFGIAFGGAGWLAGDSGFFVGFNSEVGGLAGDLYGETFSGGTAAFFIFQFMFAAVSLAIVWGTTLERMKFAAYIPFALIFAGVIYPLIAHWGFGGGLFSEFGDGVQDFAGSSVVHLTGATAALAAVMVLGPRKGKYGPDGRPRAIPGHNMPLFGLGVLILWLGWFGFNGASTLGTGGNRFAEVIAVTNLGAAAGVITACITVSLVTKRLDVGMAGNGAIAGLVAITAPSGYVEFWAAPIIGGVAGVIVVFGVLIVDKYLDDPVGAISAHGLAGIWGTLACGLFTSPRLAEAVGIGKEGLLYGGGRRPARDAGGRGRPDVRRGVHPLVRDVLRHQGDDRAAGGRGGRARGARHRRARDVRLSRAVHPGLGAGGIRCGAYGASSRRAVGVLDDPRGGPRNMKLVNAYIRHEAFEPIRTELLELGFPSLSIMEVKGSGRQKGITERYRGAEVTNYLRPKIKIECIVASGTCRRSSTRSSSTRGPAPSVTARSS